MMKPDYLTNLFIIFDHKASAYEEWSKSKEEFLLNQDLRNCSLNDVREMRKKQEIFGLDLSSQHKRVQQIASFANQLISFGHSDSHSIQSRSKKICDHWNRLLILVQQRSVVMKMAEEVLERIDTLHFEFAQRVVPFNNWLDSALNDLMDVFIVRYINELQELVDACQQFKMKLSKADNEHFAIVSLSQEISSIAILYNISSPTVNPYTQLTAQEISSKWQEVKQLLPKRDQSLLSEQLKEQFNENRCRIYAIKANKVGPWIGRQIGSVVAVETEANITLEDKLSKLSQHQMAVQLYKPHLDELETIHQLITNHSIINENKYTHYTIETLRNGWEQLMSSIQRNISEVENQMSISDSKAITAEKLNEFRILFNQFDKDGTGRLNRKQLMLCLKAYIISNHRESDKTKYSDFNRIMNVVDPKDTGFIAFDAFLDFMTNESANTGSEQQIINSFRTLASNKPYITVEDLKQLSPDKADYCIKKMKSYNGADTIPGALDYISFCKILCEKDQSLRTRINGFQTLQTF